MEKPNTSAAVSNAAAPTRAAPDTLSAVMAACAGATNAGSGPEPARQSSPARGGQRPVKRRHSACVTSQTAASPAAAAALRNDAGPAIRKAGV
eukprot:CAMPEP_0117552604 /NCGR_PEP_ID=MMETSP0784-20121206/49792_1 /TAXON_ID=39447 /ORGANISM="" /LENGTH=92 /DNA_ID=CAMNT_0005349679 /DNA_START=284 /DNA_END=559 /DNA_ORIENTATION=+